MRLLVRFTLMDLPNIFELLALVDGWRGYPAVGVVLVTAVLIAIAWDWRLSIFALMIHYLFAGLLIVELLDPRLAAVKVLTGLFICLILYFTARQVNWGRPPEDVTAEEAAQLTPPRTFRWRNTTLSLTVSVRLGITVAAALLALLLGRLPALRIPILPEATPFINVAVLGLLLLGITALALAREPLQAGMGLLLVLTGFELLYGSADQSVTVLAVLAAVNFGMALIISYLTQARFSFSEPVND